jgi:hypothetical protein
MTEAALQLSSGRRGRVNIARQAHVSLKSASKSNQGISEDDDRLRGDRACGCQHVKHQPRRWLLLPGERQADHDQLHDLEQHFSESRRRQQCDWQRDVQLPRRRYLHGKWLRLTGQGIPRRTLRSSTVSRSSRRWSSRHAHAEQAEVESEARRRALRRCSRHE